MRYWVEKSIVRQNPLRQRYILGRSLVSPTASDSGMDVYRFMRDVAPDDVILHLVDNASIVGASVVTEGYRVSDRLYTVALRGFTKFTPALDRGFLTKEPFRGRLLRIAESGRKYLFFTRLGTLRQGSYLTPLDADVLTILNEYYSVTTGGLSLPLNDQALS